MGHSVTVRTRSSNRPKSPSRRLSWAALALLAALAHGQAFDAASVKPAAGGRYVEPAGGPGTADPGRIRYVNTALQSLLLAAYNLQSFQLAGPDWLDAERFDIDAILPPETTKEQFRTMLQNLLATRFQMKTHRETRELAGYALVAVRNGPKLTESTEDPGPPDASAAPPPLQLGKDGFFIPPRRPGRFLQLIGLTAVRETFRQSTMHELAASLQGHLKRPVTDATGLAARYDFTLTFAVEGLDMGRGRMPVGPVAMENPPSLPAALQSQLGLRLEARKWPVEMLVIDHAEKIPTAN